MTLNDLLKTTFVNIGMNTRIVSNIYKPISQDRLDQYKDTQVDKISIEPNGVLIVMKRRDLILWTITL